jgi:hypothetical protein
MNTQELKERFMGYNFLERGQFRIYFKYKKGIINCITTNKLALDRINEDSPKRDYGRFYKTEKQALISLYEECKMKNNL